MKTEPLGKSEELEDKNNSVVDQVILGCDIDESGGFTELQQLKQENEKLRDESFRYREALCFIYINCTCFKNRALIYELLKGGE